MLSRTRNLPEVDGAALVHPYSRFPAARGALPRFQPVGTLIKNLGRYLRGFLKVAPFPHAIAKGDRGAPKAGAYYTGYYANGASDSPPMPPEGAEHAMRRQKRDPYYYGYSAIDNPGRATVQPKTAKCPITKRKSGLYYEDTYYIIPVADPDPSSEEEARNEIERHWKGEIERYIKMGGEKECFIDFINAARTGFPDERDQEANDKVNRFRESFIDMASRDDILHVMELHSNIRAQLERSERDYLAQGDEEAYRECAGRISRLDRGKRQLQLVLKRKFADPVS